MLDWVGAEVHIFIPISTLTWVETAEAIAKSADDKKVQQALRNTPSQAHAWQEQK